MRLFSFLKPKPFFTKAQNDSIVAAIKNAELLTSGEVRVFVEGKCKFINAIDRAAEIFYALKMDKTEQRNAVLVYIALKDRQMAIYGDEGIYNKTGQPFWDAAVKRILSFFNKEDYAAGISAVVKSIGDALQQHFPYDKATDKNELPDDIIFGK